jgi:hypothetical protein
MIIVKKIHKSSTLICAVIYNFLAAQKAQLPMCAVQTQAPDSPARNVFIMRLFTGSFVINRLSGKLADYIVLPEDGGSTFPRKNR